MQFGQCHLSVIPVRADHLDSAEMVTQVLLGEVFLVTAFHNQWRKIKLAHDGYEGWIDEKQMISISEEDFNEIQLEKKHSYAICQDAESQKRTIQLVKGSLLPYFNNQNFQIGQENFYIDSRPYYKENINREDISAIALEYLETPYLWGGRTPFGIDCSGFSQIVYKLAGISLKRDASQQVQQGKKVNLLYAQTGDLAFFINENKKIHHVGILLADDKIIHAAGKVRIDSLDEKGIYNNQAGKYTHKLHSVNTYL